MESTGFLVDSRSSVGIAVATPTEGEKSNQLRCDKDARSALIRESTIGRSHPPLQQAQPGIIARVGH